jgi:hypothetical protein
MLVDGIAAPDRITAIEKCTRATPKRDCSRERIPRQQLLDAVLDLLQQQILDRQHLANVHYELTMSLAGQLEEQETHKKELAAQRAIVSRQKNPHRGRDCGRRTFAHFVGPPGKARS